jgi:hypothetical protein
MKEISLAVEELSFLFYEFLDIPAEQKGISH